MSLGQTSNFSNATDLLAYCAENPTLQAGYAPTGDVSGSAGDTQVLDCSEWPSVLPPTAVTVTEAAATTTTTCFQLFGSTEPCVGPIGEYTLLVLIALGLGAFWMFGRGR
jgi:hypothetical protein